LPITFLNVGVKNTAIIIRYADLQCNQYLVYREDSTPRARGSCLWSE